jgi:signal transduction histidine kinase
MPALVGLLFVVFAIAGLLVYEAWSTGRSRREIAERGLQDYAAYATWSTARAGDAALWTSLSTLFQGVTANRTTPSHSLAELATVVKAAEYMDDCDCTLRIPADYYFRLDLRDGRIEVAPPPRAEISPVASGWAAAKVGSFAPVESPSKLPADSGRWLISEFKRMSLASESSFGVAFLNRDNLPVTVGFAPQRDSAGNAVGVLGFVASSERFASSLFGHLWRNAKILPVGITRGVASDSLLTASVSTSAGRELYRSSGWESNLVSDTASLAPFGGGLRVHVALRRDAMARLGGGLIPSSRIPVWVGLLLLTGVLAVIILRNLQREHELAQLRADFTASVSHELRTPLAQILLFGETLTLGRTRSQAERTRAAEIIVREARRLMQMVENTLQFSRAERPAVGLSPERLRLAPAISDTVAAFEPLASARGVTIVTDLDEDATALVDRSALRQMVINLVDNAVKYGPSGQTVTVWLSAPQTSVVLNATILSPAQTSLRQIVRIGVDDEGPGISGRSRDDIWAPFVRGRDGESSPSTGCGLGLAVVRELATSQNGRAWAESVPDGRGSRFIIELPSAPASQATRSAESSAGAEVSTQSSIA